MRRVVALVAIAGCAHPRPAATLPARETSPEAAVAARDATATTRAPEAAPAEFTGPEVSRVDVDGDGRDDLVRGFAELPLGVGARVDVDSLGPVLVAHALDDGRYALDDDVTRASLRALCPAPPAATPYAPAPGDADADHRPAYARALFVEGLCRRVWGASTAEAAAMMREGARAAPGGRFDAGFVDAAVAALGATPVPITLRAMSAPPLPHVPERRTESPPVDASPPRRDPGCAAVDRAHARWFAALNRALRTTTADAVPSDDRVGSHCRATPAGRWTITLGPASGLRERVASATATLRWEPAGAAALVGATFAQSFTSDETTSTELVGLCDYDGDGAPEAVVATTRWQEEGDRVSTLSVYTARDGAVRSYAAAPRGDVREVVDADGDGRLDLVLASPWRASGPCGVMGETHVGPTLLAHALPDGTFSRTDRVARAWAAARCSVYEAPRDGAANDVVDVACARLRGASAEAVVAGAAARTPVTTSVEIEQAMLPRVCLSFQALAATAVVAPPFTLTPTE